MSASQSLMVIGTRPEAIKLAPLALAMEEQGFPPLLVLTGQHPRLDLDDLGVRHFAARHLHHQANGDPHAYADQVAAAILREIRAEAGRLVIVQGDTSSALGGALAGFRAGVPVAHVEAGLRSFDPAMPWPEEDNRVAIDAGSALLFAPTETSAANLRAEGVGGAIHVTGNTGIDALRRVIGHLPPLLPRPLGGSPRLLVTCHRRENWGTAFLPVALALLELAKLPWLGIDVVLHPNPGQADLMRDLMSADARIRLLQPLDHRSMIAAMTRSTIILSDSGGVQEEAPALGIPLLVLRTKTERPEAIECGSMKLVGTDPERIVAEVRHLLGNRAAYAEMAAPRLPFGDGHSAVRIARIIADWLGNREHEDVRLTA